MKKVNGTALRLKEHAHAQNSQGRHASTDGGRLLPTLPRIRNKAGFFTKG